MKAEQDKIILIRALGDIVATIVAQEFGVPSSHIFAKARRTSSVVLARQTTICFLHVLFGCSPTQIAKAVKRDRSTICHACHVIEDYRDDRDDRVFDGRISILERKITFLSDVKLLI